MQGVCGVAHDRWGTYAQRTVSRDIALSVCTYITMAAYANVPASEAMARLLNCWSAMATPKRQLRAQAGKMQAADRQVGRKTVIILCK